MPDHESAGLPSRREFYRLTKEQLMQLAVVEDVELEDNMRKPAIAAHLLTMLRLESLWQIDEDREHKEQEREEREREKQSEHENKMELARLEVEKAKYSVRVSGGAQEPRFDMSKARMFMPKFDEDTVDVFFEAFEKVAIEMEWPREKWALLVQSVLLGKAQAAFAALDCRVGLEYEDVRKAVLAAYGSVPEAYRKKFRALRRKPGESYLDLWRKQGVALERWLNSCSAFDYTQLKDLFLLEQLKISVPRHVEVYLSEREVTNPQKAAQMADNYEVIHGEVPGRGFDRKRPAEEGAKADFPKRQSEGNGNRQVSTAEKPNHFVSRFRQPPWRQNGPPQSFSQSSTRSHDIICHYCRKPGHLKSQCPLLKAKAEYGKAVALVSAGCAGLESPGGYDGFTSLGAVSEFRDGPQASVTILRDTGATQSLLLKGAVDLPESTFLGKSAIIKGLGGCYGAVPLHRIYLESNLVTDYVTVGVVPNFPCDGIGLILGNDLAGTKVCMALEVSEQPCDVPATRELELEYPEVFSACVLTRAQAQKEAAALPPVDNSREQAVELGDTFLAQLDGSGLAEGPEELITAGPEVGTRVLEIPSLSRESLVREQQKDPSLTDSLKIAMTSEEIKDVATGYFLRNDVLMRKWRPVDRPAGEEWSVCEQVVLPECYRTEVLSLAHESPFGGHFGVRKTLTKITRHFYWPHVRRDVVAFCRSCHACQVAGKSGHPLPAAPLNPLPVVEEPFSEVLIDCVGPLHKTRKGNEYLLTVLDMATRFPEAFPLRNIKAQTIVDHLMQFFSRVGLPRSIQSDRGSNFTSGVFQEVMFQLGVTQKTSSAYHPQSQGAIERFHATLKSMIRTYSECHPRDWDEAMPFLLFAIRDAPSESLGFSPFELVYGHEVRGPLRMLKERVVEPAERGDVLQYVATFKSRLKSACETAHKNLAGAKARMKSHYDRKTVARTFAPGDQVLVLVPGWGDKLGSRFCGPYPVVKQVGDLNYVVGTPDRRSKTRLCHLNSLKAYVDRAPEASVCCVVVEHCEGEEEPELGCSPPAVVSARLQNT